MDEEVTIYLSGRSFTINQQKLCAQSDYFQSLFSTRWATKTSMIVDLSNKENEFAEGTNFSHQCTFEDPENCFPLIVKYIVNSEMIPFERLSIRKIVSLLKLSSFLIMKSVLNECVNFLLHTLDQSCLVGLDPKFFSVVKQLTEHKDETIFLEPLRQKYHSYLIKNFHSISSKIWQINIESFLMITKSDHLNVKDEYEVFSTVMAYKKSKVLNDSYDVLLLKNVRLLFLNSLQRKSMRKILGKEIIGNILGSSKENMQCHSRWKKMTWTITEVFADRIELYKEIYDYTGCNWKTSLKIIESSTQKDLSNYYKLRVLFGISQKGFNFKLFPCIQQYDNTNRADMIAGFCGKITLKHPTDKKRDQILPFTDIEHYFKKNIYSQKLEKYIGPDHKIRVKIRAKVYFKPDWFISSMKLLDI